MDVPKEEAQKPNSKDGKGYESFFGFLREERNNIGRAQLGENNIGDEKYYYGV